VIQYKTNPFTDRGFMEEFFSPLKKQTEYFTGDGEGTEDKPWILKAIKWEKVEKTFHAWYDEDEGFHKVPQKEIEE